MVPVDASRPHFILPRLGRWEDNNPGYARSYGQDVWQETGTGGGSYSGTIGEGMSDVNYPNPDVTAAAHRVSASSLTEMGADGFRRDAFKHLIADGENQDNTPCHPRLAARLPSLYGSALVPLAEEAETGVPNGAFATFRTCHDQTRAMTLLDGDVAAAKIAVTPLLTLPGTPFFSSGEELGVTGNKPDPLLRAPMPWQAGPGGEFTTGAPWQPFADDPASPDVADQLADPASLLNYYRALIALRTAHPVLSHGDPIPVQTRPHSFAASVHRAGSDVVLVIINFGIFGDRPTTDLTLTFLPSDVALGRYELRPLLGNAPPTTLDTGSKLGRRCF